MQGVVRLPSMLDPVMVLHETTAVSVYMMNFSSTDPMILVIMDAIST